MSHVLFVNENPAEVLPLIPFVEYKGSQASVAKNIREATALLSTHEEIDIIIADSSLIETDQSNLLSVVDGRPGKHLFLMKDEMDKRPLNDISIDGVEEFFLKPITVSHLEQILREEASTSETSCLNNIALDRCGSLIGSSPIMQELYDLIQKVAATSANVFIIGESGTGKELVAQAIHQQSGRANKPFIAINCGAMAPELIASALFGHEKGSFTGATHTHSGYFEQASGGTLFLDEITETSHSFQVQLLRVLESDKIMPVGGKREVAVDVRVLASTNRCAEKAVMEGILRKDLYYRLNVFPIYMPSLNERQEDISLLAEYFLKHFNEQEQKLIKFTGAALEFLQSRHYTGNVRELKNLVFRACILANELIDVHHLQKTSSLTESSLVKNNFCTPIDSSLDFVKKEFVHLVLKHYRYDKTLAANSLNISRSDLNNILQK